MTDRYNFNTVLLEEGECINNEKCPNCGKWVCGFPDIKIRPYNGKRSMVEIWECWGCETEFIQVLNYK